MNVTTTLSLIFGVLYLSSIVNCSDTWCPCFQTHDSRVENVSKHLVTPHVCEKYKGQFISEEREFKCECCVIKRSFEQRCEPAKNPMFVVKCEEGLECDHKYVCRAQNTRFPKMMMVKNQQPDQQISDSFESSFADMLRKAFGCDCSTTKCDNEVTRLECEDHQGLFVDKQSVRNRCQCCDQCYIPRGQHQSCSNYHKKNVQYVCDTGLYCSPFTHMCIEKHEIFSQFMKKVKKENKLKKTLGVFEEEHVPEQSILVSLKRKKRGGEDDEEGDAPEKPEKPESKEPAKMEELSPEEIAKHQSAPANPEHEEEKQAHAPVNPDKPESKEAAKLEEEAAKNQNAPENPEEEAAVAKAEDHAQDKTHQTAHAPGNPEEGEQEQTPESPEQSDEQEETTTTTTPAPPTTTTTTTTTPAPTTTTTTRAPTTKSKDGKGNVLEEIIKKLKEDFEKAKKYFEDHLKGDAAKMKAQIQKLKEEFDKVKDKVQHESKGNLDKAKGNYEKLRQSWSDDFKTKVDKLMANPTTSKTSTTTPKASTTTLKASTTTPKASTTTPKASTTTPKAKTTPKGKKG